MKTTSVCAICKEEKSITEFHHSAKNKCKGYDKLYPHSYCKKCNKELCSAYYHANKHKWRELKLAKAFGLSVEEYKRMLKAQGGRCAICRAKRSMVRGKSRTSKQLSVDHDHSTKKVRALLCNRCNRVLGLCGDDPNLLRAAAAYLEKFKKQLVTAIEQDFPIRLVERFD
jgi:hypothetical protein